MPIKLLGMNSVSTANDLTIERPNAPAKSSNQESSTPSRHSTNEFFTSQSTTRMVGLITVILLLISGSITFLILVGLTPFDPDNFLVTTSALVINGILAIILLVLIGREVAKILRSRKKGRAASRLHVRIIVLFSLVAATPAIIVAIVAGITLDLGLDRWFEIRTKNIIQSSVDVAIAYQNESTRSLAGHNVSIAVNLDRNRQLFTLDKSGFQNHLTLLARSRGFTASHLISDDGTIILKAKLPNDANAPRIHADALKDASEGNPVVIPRGDGIFIGTVAKLREIPDTYLYSVATLPESVIGALQLTKDNVEKYNRLEQNRFPVQVAFAILYTGLCLVVLLAAIWMGISVADRIVSPIRRLISAAGEVSSGNLAVSVDTHRAEGDLRFLGETFNVMISDLKNQQEELVTARDEMDQRARFTETVLSGVSAGVIGVNADRNVTIANRSASEFLSIDMSDGNQPVTIADVAPELDQVLLNAIELGRIEHREQITLRHEGRERALNVQVTREEDQSDNSYVITIDDITDLVAAQRNTAWSDVARRIAHEIKNPLTPIQLSAERIRRRFGKQINQDKEVFDQCTETIVRQVGDIGRMVDEFSSFARMPAPEFTEASLTKIIRETVFLEKVGFPEIEFTANYPKEAILCNLDTRLFSQAIINVLKNAAEAIEAVPADELEKGEIQIEISVENDQAVVDVIDNGKGLPEENRQMLLEPYMTTREKGTGLGLAIVRKILEDHGGSIELLDAPMVAMGGRGAMMRLKVPTIAQKEEHTEDLETDNQNKVKA